ncbi:hypothetical protein PMZ80_010840 [Knufia obscura]|uniref:Uncharacterized protein n=2 Tax=Knufia TaxID=430999 RepID=A0AAN8I4I4_9EURO|nr:hypothetical protein PMZ80_010840 [Knufia obscura]KAK5951754.1 hypothetical protein OHC33_007046 [Knufia fluminis]
MAARNMESSPTLNASSAVKKSGMSITLPRNFAPLSLDPADAPRTPDQTFAQLDLPPPPPHSTYRVRRPRVNLSNFQDRDRGLPATLFASDIPVPSSAGPWSTEFSKFKDFSDDIMPSVESTSTPTRPHLLQSFSEPVHSERLRLVGDAQAPYTPPSQTTRTPADIKRGEWDMQRAASVSSHKSNSSVSTTETYETRPTSYDGSVIGADNEVADPFSPSKNIKVIPATPSRKSKKARLTSFFAKNNVEWTIEMDNHLFNVYQIYLADPTVTPFKTVPGSIPPTGVCHRVARRAKETWPKASRVELPIVQRYKVRSLLDIRMNLRATTPDPEDFLNTSCNDRRPSWPSESATRKRLKQLCREKFTISAHYNRLRESRSPSPFSDQFMPKKPSRLSASPVHNDNDAYTTRELHINLVASGATEPLAQLTTGDSPPMESALESFNREIESAEQNQMNTSPPTGLGIKEEQPVIDQSKLAPATNIPRLASPFSYNTWNGPIRPENRHRRFVSQNHFETMHATGPRLRSPFQPEGELGLNVNKRRAQHNLEDELSPSGSSLAGHTSGLNLDEPLSAIVQPEPEPELIFTGLGDVNQRRVRLRNRGATLGTAHEKIARLFTPLATGEDDMPPVPAIPSQFSSTQNDAQVSGLKPPQVDEGQRRLGSPFELDPNKRSFRNKPRHLPSLSDPFIQFTHGMPTSSTATQQNNNIGNIGDRLASFQQSLDEYKTPKY